MAMFTVPLPGVRRVQFPSTPSEKSKIPVPKTTTTVDPFYASKFAYIHAMLGTHTNNQLANSQ